MVRLSTDDRTSANIPPDRILIPQLQYSSNASLATINERQSVYRSESFTPRVKEQLARWLDPNDLSQM
jgi:hypothetical protein